MRLLKSIKDFIEDIRIGIYNLIFFLPAVWKFRSYDHHFATVMLYYTYKRILKQWEKRRIYIGQIEEVFILREIVNKLEKSVEDEDYLQEALDLIHRHYFRFWN